MGNPSHSTDAPKPHAIDIHPDTQPLHIVAVTISFIAFDELAFTPGTDVILLIATMTILANMLTPAFWTLPRLTVLALKNLA